MNVLITSVSRKVSLVRAWKRAVNLRGGNLIVADMDPMCAGMWEGDACELLPPIDTESFQSRLFDIVARHSVDLIVPTRDQEVMEFSTIGDFGVRILTPHRDVVRICQDKISFGLWCYNHGFKTPTTFRNPGDVDSYPAFVRFRRGSGGSLCKKVHTFTELEALVNSWGKGDCLIQEFIRGPEYSVDVFSSRYGRVICAVPRLRVQVVAGESYVSRTVENQDIVDAAVYLAEQLGLVGHSVLQCFYRDGDVLWIEVNPRFGGATALSLEAGCKSPDWLLDELEGKGLPTPLAPYEPDVTMLRYTQDRFVRLA